ADWMNQHERTTYLFDVRTRQEFELGTLNGAFHAPGGQLVQATDEFVAVRGARIVVVDDDLVRAPTTAGWLRQMGWDVHVLREGVDTEWNIEIDRNDEGELIKQVRLLDGPELVQAYDDKLAFIDLRSSIEYRRAHV